MKIGIIGPSKLEKMAKSIGKSQEEITKIFSKIAEVLAKKEYEIIVTLDKNSSSEFIAKEYIKFKGKKVTNVIPMDDKEFGYSWVNTEIGDKINCGTWENQPERIVKEADLLVCVGYAEGSIIEACYTKWFGQNTVYIIKELVSGKLPVELEDDLDLKYVSYKVIKEWL